MKQSKGVRLFVLSLLFLFGVSWLISIYGNWSPQLGQVITFQMVLFGLVIVAWLVSILMEIIGLENWTWVVFLLLLPVALANVIGLHLDDYLGMLNFQDRDFIDSLGIIETRDRPFIFAYLTLFSNLIMLIITWHQRKNAGMADELEDEPHRLSS